jgi:2-iminobutanoate/2-iminopropanoate deaminase
MAKLAWINQERRELDRAWGWSSTVKVNGLIFIAGTGAVDDNGEVICPGDAKGQMNALYDQIEKILAFHGATLEQMVQETWFTIDMDQMADAWTERGKRYANFEFPSTAGSEVTKLDLPELLFEFQSIAVDPNWIK